MLRALKNFGPLSLFVLVTLLAAGDAFSAAKGKGKKAPEAPAEAPPADPAAVPPPPPLAEYIEDAANGFKIQPPNGWTREDPTVVTLPTGIVMSYVGTPSVAGTRAPRYYVFIETNADTLDAYWAGKKAAAAAASTTFKEVVPPALVKHPNVALGTPVPADEPSEALYVQTADTEKEATVQTLEVFCAFPDGARKLVLICSALQADYPKLYSDIFVPSFKTMRFVEKPPGYEGPGPDPGTTTPPPDSGGTEEPTPPVEEPAPKTGKTPVEPPAAPENTPPELGKLPAQVRVPIGETATIKLQATDPDKKERLTFSADPVPEGATINPKTGLFNFSPKGKPGSITVTFTVTDSQGASDTEVVEFVVLRGGPPAITVEGSTEGKAGETVRFTVTAAYPDGTKVPVTAVKIPKTAKFAAGVFTMKSPVAGEFPVVFTATDASGQKATETVTVAFKAVRTDPPKISVEGSREAKVGETIRLTVKAVLSDGTKVSVAAAKLPKGAKFAGGVFTMKSSQPGEHSLTFTALDPATTLKATESVSISFKGAAPPPPPPPPDKKKPPAKEKGTTPP